MATGDKLVNLDELKLVYDKLHVPSVQVQIPTGQWSGSSTRTYTVNATGVTTDTIIDWAMDSSINYLTSELTVTPGSGTLTFSTPTLPAGTINVTLFFPGVNGEVVIQTLADVYSKSQVDTLLAAKVSTSNIINNLTSTATDKPLSAAQGKQIKDNIGSTAEVITPIAGDNVTINDSYCYRIGRIVTINISFTMTADATSTQQLIKGLPQPAAAIPIIAVRNLGGGGYQCFLTQSGNINNNYDAIQSGKKYFINAAYVITTG